MISYSKLSFLVVGFLGLNTTKRATVCDIATLPSYAYSSFSLSFHPIYPLKCKTPVLLSTFLFVLHRNSDVTGIRRPQENTICKTTNWVTMPMLVKVTNSRRALPTLWCGCVIAPSGLILTYGGSGSYATHLYATIPLVCF